MRIWGLLLVCAWFGLVCGCGKGGVSGVKIDPAPFQAAVSDYCRDKNYGMAIAEMVSLKQEGDTAVMVCKMKEAEGLYGVAVTWEFNLRRDQERWTVTGHIKK